MDSIDGESVSTIKMAGPNPYIQPFPSPVSMDANHMTVLRFKAERSEPKGSLEARSGMWY